MKDHARYRIIAIDHDFISFTDKPLSLSQTPKPQRHNLITNSPSLSLHSLEKTAVDPIVLITHPRDARFASTAHEPLERFEAFGCVRVLVYNQTRIVSFKVLLDGVDVSEDVVVRYVGNTKSWTSVDGDVEDGRNHIPLWIIEGRGPLLLLGGRGEIEIVVVDERGLEGVAKSVYRMDGEKDGNGWIGGFVSQMVVQAPFEFLVCGKFDCYTMYSY
jgi:hypothetical protein